MDAQEDSGAFVSVDRQEVLDLMENYLQPYGTIKAVTISDDVMIVSMSGLNLQEISAMFEILQQQPIVKAADPYNRLHRKNGRRRPRFLRDDHITAG